MGLIVCPHCGKQVSDTNEKCFHCGLDLANDTEEAAKPREYYKMSAKEQQDLRKEYLSQNPVFERCMKKSNAFTKRNMISIIICVLAWLCFACMFIGSIIYLDVAKKNMPAWVNLLVILILVIAFVTMIICIVQRILYRKHRRNELIIEKNYQQWLKSEKNVNYTVAFTAEESKDKKIFDEIDITKDKLEG